MDPLSIAASIAGLLAAAVTIKKQLESFIFASRDAPQIACKIYSELQSTRAVLQVVKNLIENIATKPVRNASLVRVDQLQIILVDGVLLFSELEFAAGCLLTSIPSSHILQLRCRLWWVRKESTFSRLLVRLEKFKHSFSFILDIVQSESLLRAEKLQKKLHLRLIELISSNGAVAEKVKSLEGVVEARTFAVRQSTSKHTSPPACCHYEKHAITQHEVSSETTLVQPEKSIDKAASASLHMSLYDFESALEASKVYRRVQRDTLDYSFRSSVGKPRWSNFSGLSLGEVSMIAVIALPICSEDLTNSQHYTFGSNGQSPPRPVRAQIAFDGERSIFHDCVEVKAQLLKIPGFAALFDDVKASQDETTNPMSELRQVFQRGFPLLILFNCWKSGKKISVSQAAHDAKKEGSVRLAVHEFLFESATLLHMDLRDLFTFDDLAGSSNVGFTKVVIVLAMVLEKLAHLHIIPTVQTLSEPSNQNKRKALSENNTLLDRFVRDERVYVAQLEQLLESRTAIERYGLLTQRSLQSIFGPISTMMDSQIQFLLEMEVNLSTSHEAQSRARPFATWCNSLAFQASEDLARWERTDREFIRAHIETISAHEYGRREEYLSILSTCRGLLSMPRLRSYKYSQFLKKVEKYDGLTFRVLLGGNYGKECATLQTRLEEATAALTAIRDSQGRIEVFRSMQEGQDVFRRLRELWKQWHEPEFQNLQAPLLFDRFRVDDAQGHCARKYIFCLSGTALVWYETNFELLEDPGKPTQSATILTTSSEGEDFFTKDTTARGCVTRFETASTEHIGLFCCTIQWLCDSNTSGSEKIHMCFDSEARMSLWAQKLEGVEKIYFSQ